MISTFEITYLIRHNIGVGLQLMKCLIYLIVFKLRLDLRIFLWGSRLYRGYIWVHLSPIRIYFIAQYGIFMLKLFDILFDLHQFILHGSLSVWYLLNFTVMFFVGTTGIQFKSLVLLKLLWPATITIAWIILLIHF